MKYADLQSGLPIARGDLFRRSAGLSRHGIVRPYAGWARMSLLIDAQGILAQELIQFRLDHAIAVADSPLQTAAFEDCQLAAAVMDQSRLPQASGRLRHSRPSYS